MDLSNLIAHWKMEEASGSRADFYGSSTLTDGGTTGNAVGILGNALDMSVGNHLYNNSNTFKFGDVNFEFNGWVNFDFLISLYTIIFQGGGSPLAYRLYTADGVHLTFQVSSDGISWTTSVTSTVALSTGTWFFFRCWHDADTDTIGIKVNTETIVTAAHSTGLYIGGIGDPSQQLYIGLSFGPGLNGLDAKLDSISVWGRILSETEGLCVYNGGLGLDYPWPCVTAGVAAVSFFEAIKRPTLTPIVLAEIGIGIWCRNWIVDGTFTNSYKVSVEREDARGKTYSLNITSVKWNLTTELTEQTSAALVDANAGSWFSDGEFLWVNPVSGSIYENTVQAFATFYFSQTGPILNDIFWEPRIASVPNLSQRIEATFGGVGQIGGGAIALFNHDGYFNAMQDFQWHHGDIIMRLGIDLPNSQVMDWQDYQVIATWKVKDWRRDETNFTINLQEPKAKIKTKVPFTFFDRTSYPNIEDSTVGKPIPIAYGRLFGIAPILIDPGLKKFKVASHAIKSFDGVRIKTNRDEQRTITTAVGDWFLYSGTVYRYYLSQEEATNVTFNAASLVNANSIDDVISTAGTWTTAENYVYVNPSSGQTIASGTYAIAAKKSVTGFTTTNFASVDAANAQFTLGNDWAIGTEVSVDFRGKANSNGTLMDNPVDIIADLLTTVSETNVNNASFATARNRFLLGYDESSNEVNCMRPSVYIDDATEVLDIIARINELAGTFLYSDELGRFHIGAFLPQTGEDLPIYTDLDMMDFEELTDSEETLSKFNTKWQERKEDAFAQVETVERTAQQYIAGQPQPVIEEPTVGLSEEADAEYWTERSLLMRGFPLKKFTFQLPWNALIRKPGEQIHIQSDARQIDEVFEILEVRRDLGTKMVTLVVGNLRNYNDTPGFWVDSSATLPATFSALAGYGVGSLTWNSAWDMTIKKWARQNIGYWSTPEGFADAADPDSFLPSVWV